MRASLTWVCRMILVAVFALCAGHPGVLGIEMNGRMDRARNNEESEESSREKP